MRAMRCWIWAAASCSARRWTHAAISPIWSSPSRRGLVPPAAQSIRPGRQHTNGGQRRGRGSWWRERRVDDRRCVRRDGDRNPGSGPHHYLSNPPAPDRFIRQAEHIPAVLINVGLYRNDDAICHPGGDYLRPAAGTHPKCPESLGDHFVVQPLRVEDRPLPGAAVETRTDCSAGLRSGSTVSCVPGTTRHSATFEAATHGR